MLGDISKQCLMLIVLIQYAYYEYWVYGINTKHIYLQLWIGSWIIALNWPNVFEINRRLWNLLNISWKIENREFDLIQLRAIEI